VLRDQSVVDYSVMLELYALLHIDRYTIQLIYTSTDLPTENRLINRMLGNELSERAEQVVPAMKFLVDPKELAHGEQIAEPASSSLRVRLIRDRVETPADAGVVEAVQRIDSTKRPVYLGWAAPVHHVEDAGVQTTRRHQAGAAVVHVEPVREHDLGEHGRVRPQGSRLRDGEAARVANRGGLDRLGGVGARRPVEPFLADSLASVRAAADVGVVALDALLEVRVPVVLQLVVGPARQVPRDVRPPGAKRNSHRVRDAVDREPH
jgi:hypothetical protein